jgi:hypothetical protein
LAVSILIRINPNSGLADKRRRKGALGGAGACGDNGQEGHAPGAQRIQNPAFALSQSSFTMDAVGRVTN